MFIFTEKIKQYHASTLLLNPQKPPEIHHGQQVPLGAERIFAKCKFGATQEHEPFSGLPNQAKAALAKKVEPALRKKIRI